MTSIESPSATAYSFQSTGVNPKADAIAGTSSTTVTSSSAAIIAPQSSPFCPFSVNTLRLWERILKLWKISHMFMVRKAMVIPSSEIPCGHSKCPTSMQCPII